MIRRRTATVLLVGALAVGVPVAAGAAVAHKPLPVKTWKKTTNNICRQAQILRDEAASEAFSGVPADGQPSLEMMTAYVGTIEPIVRQQIDSIDALREPVALRKKVKKMLTTAREELDALVASPGNGLEGNPFSGTELAAKKLGLKQCYTGG